MAWKSLSFLTPLVWLVCVVLFAALLQGRSAHAADVFSFTSTNYIVSEAEGSTYEPSQGASYAGAMVTVTRGGEYTGKLLVDYIIKNATATNGIHFLAPGGSRAPAVTNTLFFDDLQASTNFLVSILDDQITNQNRQVSLVLTNARVASNETAVVEVPKVQGITNSVITILDDEPGFNIERATFRIAEAGPEIVIGVVLKIGGTNGIAVDYETVSGGFTTQAGSDYATADADYTTTQGTLTFDVGEMRKTITIPILEDDLTEFNEDLQVRLLNIQGDLSVTNDVLVTNSDNTITTNQQVSAVTYAQFGKVTNASITILSVGRSDLEQPAGAAAANWNAPTPLSPTAGANNAVYAIHIQADGRTLVGGEFTSVNGVVRNRVARLESIGTIDWTFDPGTGADGYVAALAEYTTGPHLGKSVIGGGFTSFNNIQRGSVARLTSAGALDLSFNPGSGADGPVFAAAVQDDGRVIIGGDFRSVNGVERAGLARLNVNGSVDTTFDCGSGFDQPVWAVALQEDGKVLVGGDFFMVDGAVRPGIARLAADGSLDTSFDPGGGADGSVYTLLYVPPSRLPVSGTPPAGSSGPGTNTVATGSTSGLVELNVDSQGTTNNLRIYHDGIVLIDTNIVLTGRVQVAYGPGVSSSLDIVMNEASGFGTNWAYNGVVFPDLADTGKILVAGSFTSFDGYPRGRLARLNLDGSVDVRFVPPLGADNTIYALKRQTDGRLLIGGAFTRVNATRRAGVARLLSDGILDTTFMDTAYNHFAGVADREGFILALAEDPASGYVLVGGRFVRLGGGPTRLDTTARLNIAGLIGGQTPGPGNVQFSSPESSYDENAVAATLLLTRENGAFGTVAVETRTYGRVAVEGLDFVGSTNTVGWQDQETNALGFAFGLIDDLTVEGNETLDVTITGLGGAMMLGGELIPTGPALGLTATTLVTIVDNDFRAGTLGFSAPVYSASESEPSATFTVVRTNGNTGAVMVDYAAISATTNGATAGLDFTARRGTLSFAPGQTNRSFTIPIIDDTEVEVDETIDLVLSNPRGGAVLGLSRASVALIDNDFAPGRLSYVSPIFTTNESGRAAMIGVRRTGGNVGVLSVDYRTVADTANSSDDFDPVSGRLIWADGDSGVKTYSVPIHDDGEVEGLEAFRVELFNPSTPGALGTQTNAQVEIVDDDTYGELQFSGPAYLADENGGVATLTVTRTGGIAGMVQARVIITGGTAQVDVDYTGLTPTVTLLPGQLSQSFSIVILDDSLVEGNETIQFSLQDPVNATLGVVSEALLTIIDNEFSNVPAGSLDTSYNPSAGPNYFVNALIVQPDGRLLVAGDFTMLNGTLRNGIGRLNFDGSLDRAFGTGVGANGPIRTLALQADGRLLVGGFFSRFDGLNRSSIARLAADGAIDSSFNPGAGLDGPVLSVAETSLAGVRKILVAGAFNSYNGTPRRNLVRVNEDGTLDASFNASAYANGSVYAVVVQPDGKILLGGDFTQVNGIARVAVARLHADGTLDTSFDSGTGPDGPVRTIVLQTDGRVVVGGLFKQVSGTDRPSVARLDPTGGLDLSFAAGVSVDGAVYTAALQSDGKVLLGGEFTRFGGVTRRRITRLNADGTVDPSINFGLGANAFVSALAVQSDRKIVLGGGFTTFNGTPRNFLARLHGGAMTGAGRLEFLSAQYLADESITNALVIVRRTGGTTGTVTVDVATIPGTTSAGEDYLDQQVTLVFPSGEPVQAFEVPVLNDTLIEDLETVQLTLSNPTGGAVLGVQPQAVLAIQSDDCVLEFSNASFTVSEGSASGRASVAVVRSGSTNGSVSVTYSTVAGTATPIADFTAVSGILTFAAGETLKTISIPVVDDSLVEGNETIEVVLSDPRAPAVLGRVRTTVTVVENDFAPGLIQFSAAAYSTTEDGMVGLVTLTRTNGTTGIVTVNVTLNDGTATFGQDYLRPISLISFAEGEVSRILAIPIMNDQQSEGDETVQVVLSNPSGGAALGPLTQAALTILDDESAISFDVTQVSASESAPSVAVSVRRSGNVLSSISVEYVTVDGSALENIDYEPRTGTVSFGPGESAKIFNLPLLNDTQAEGDEFFLVQLRNIQGSAELGRSELRILIRDDDIPPSNIGFELATTSVAENETNAVISVVRTGDTQGSVSAAYATTDGTAVLGLDYTSVSGTVFFGAGQTNATLVVPLLDDGLLEGDETVNLQLFDLVGGGAARTNAILRILDNEASLSLATNVLSVAEDGTNAVVTVLRSNGLAGTIRVDYAALLGTNNPALPGVDFAAVSGQLVFTNGQGTNSFSIPILDDFLVESNETVRVVLSNPAGAAFVGFNEAELTVIDNDTAAGGFQFAGAPYLGSESNELLRVSVERLSGISGDVSVEIELTSTLTNQFTGGTTNAVAGYDVVPLRMTLSWTNGEAGIKNANFTVTNDTEVELIESLGVRLVNPTGGATLDANNHETLALIVSEDQPAGAADIAFNMLTAANPTPGANSTVYTIVVYTNGPNAGKSLIGGDFTAVNAVVRNRIARLNPDGSVDSSFDPGSGVDGFVSAIALQADEKILIAGGFTTYNNTSRNQIARLNEDGSLDASFQPGLGANGPINDILISPNGTIIVAGEFTSVNGIARNRIAAINPNGSVNLSFTPGLGANGSIRSLAYVAQRFIGWGVTNLGSGPAEHRTNIFTGASSGSITVTYDFDLQPDALRIYYGTTLILDTGLVNTYAVVTNTDGTFSTNTQARVATVNYGPGLAQDLSVVIDEGNRLPGAIWSYSATVQPNNPQGVLIVGDFTTVEDVPRNRVARLSANGRLDPNFDPGSGADSTVHSIGLLSDGSVVIGGDFAVVDGLPRHGLARLLPEGPLDVTFDPGSGFDGPVYRVFPRWDGGCLVGGHFSSFNGTGRTNLARVYADGTLDTTFLDTYYNQRQPGPDQFVTALATNSVPSILMITNSVVTNGITNLVIVTNIVAGEKVLIGGGFTQVGGGLSLAEVARRFHFAQVLGGSSPGPGNFQFALANYAADENALNGEVTLTVERVNGAVGAVAVDFTTRGDSAEAGRDYLTTQGTLVWTNAEAGPKTVRVPVVDNSSVEGNRSFRVELSNARGLGEYAMGSAALGYRTSATVLIVDNDFRHGQLAFSAAVFSANENGGIATIAIARNEGSTGAVSVDYTTTDGTAQEGADFQPKSGTLFFSSGQTNRTFTIVLQDDSLIEPDETVNLKLLNPVGGATLGTRSNSVLVIIDNDFAPGRAGFDQVEYSVNEFGGFATIGVRRDGGSAGIFSVKYGTADVSAQAPFDYSESSGTLLWNDGDTDLKFFTVPVANDGFVEGDEALLLRLFSPSAPGGLGLFTNALLTLRDDDFPGQFEFNAGTLIADENGGDLSIIITRRQGSAGPASVQFTSSALTAVSGQDFQDIAAVVTFGPGDVSRTVSLPILDDSALDGEKQLLVTLFNPVNAGLGGVTNLTVRIIDNESVRQSAGSLDPDFNIGEGPNNAVYALALQRDGKLLVGGTFSEFNRTAKRGLARLNPDGQLDSSFERRSGTDGLIRALLIDGQERIVLGGSFNFANDIPLRNLARLSRSGTLDVVFNPGQGPDNPLQALAEWNGQLAIAGEFTAINSIARRGFAVLDGSGVLIPRLNSGSGAQGIVYAVAVLRDGKILIGGDFNVVSGALRPSIARFNADGTLDTTFNAGLGADDSVRAIAVQADDRIVIGGLFTVVSGVTRPFLARLQPDGSVDPTFDTGLGADGPVYAMALQPDGDLIVGGDFTEFHGIRAGRVARLTPEGRLDTRINFGSGANGFISAIALQEDRKIVLGGGFTEFNGVPRRQLARVFGGSSVGPGEFEFALSSIVAREGQTNAAVRVRRTGGITGKASVDLRSEAVTAEPFSDYQDVRVTLEFASGESVKEVVIAILDDLLAEAEETVQLVLTNVTGGAGLGRQPVALLRIVSDDSTLSFGEPEFSVAESSLAQSATIRVVRIGESSNTVSVAYQTLNGTALSGSDYIGTSGRLTFGPGVTNQTFSIGITDDTLVEENETVLLRLQAPSGSAVLGESSATLTIVDDDFAAGLLSFESDMVLNEAAGAVRVTVRRSSGRSGVVTVDYRTVQGSATETADYRAANGTLTFIDGESAKTFLVVVQDDIEVEGNEVFSVVLENPTGGAILGSVTAIDVTVVDDDFGPGSLDLSFNPAAAANSSVRSLFLQPDGKVVLAGDFTTLNGGGVNRIGRLHPDGFIDSSFVTAGGADRTVWSAAPTAGGGIAIGGEFSAVAGATRRWAARFTTNGFLDNVFQPSAGINGPIYAIAAQQDGKFVVGGSFAVPAGNVARLNANGSLDVSFDPDGGANGPLYAAVVQADGKVLLGGDFTSMGGMSRRGLARLTPNGLLDSSFDPDAAVDGPVRVIVIQPDGRILIGGEFSTVRSAARRGVARLNPDGSLDYEFQPGTGVNGPVYGAAVQADGKIYIAGSFTAVQGLLRNNVARLDFGGTLDLSFDPGRGPDGPVYDIAVEAAGKVIIGGAFQSVSGFPRERIARLNGDETEEVEAARFVSVTRSLTGEVELSFVAPIGRTYHIEWSEDLRTWAVLTLIRTTDSQVDFTDRTTTGTGRRFYRLRWLAP